VWQSYADPDGDSHSNTYSYSDGYGNSDSNSYGNFDCHPNGYSGAEGYSITETSSDTAATTVRLANR